MKIIDVMVAMDDPQVGGGCWLVGVSGGGDSVALLRMLVAQGYGARLVVGHFNHRWSAWGDEAEAFVRKLAAELGLEVAVGYGTGRAATNAEAVAREERRQWFLATVAARGLSGVALAHTRTDQVEGFLMRAGKGSGVRGLAGMLAVQGVVGKRTWRPLLEVGREALRAYLRELGQGWLDDPADAAGENQRARVRALLPALEAAGVTEEGLAGCVAAMRRADSALRAQQQDFWRDYVREGEGWVRLARGPLLALPEEVAGAVLARVLQRGQGEVMVSRSGKRLDLLARVRGEVKGVATLGGMRFAWESDAVTVTVE